MKFDTEKNKNPFDNFLLAGAVHTATVCGAVVAAYFSLTNGTLVPMYLAGGVILVLEGAWLYYRLR